MITQETKATTRHFFAALAAALVIGLISSAARYFMPNMLIGDLAAILMFCVLAYLVLVHYTSVFIYVLGEGSLTVTRKIGAREKQIKIKTADVVSVSAKKPQGVRTDSMCVAVFSKKKAICVAYKSDGGLRGVWIEPQGELADELLGLGKKKK